jgi:hypothetical protein
MLKLENNPISNIGFSNIEKLIKSSEFFFHIDDSQECVIFNHILYFGGQMNSSFAHVIKPLINFIDRSIINAKICIVPKTEKKIELIKKIEDSFEPKPTQKCFYFINKNNGHLNVFNVGDVFPEQNRAFLVHSNIDIQNFSCTDQKYKAYIEIEYFADK